MKRSFLVAFLAAFLVACGEGRGPAQAPEAAGADSAGETIKEVVSLGDPSQCANPTAPVYQFRRNGGAHMLVADEATKTAMQADPAMAFYGEIFRQVVCGQAAVPVYRFTDRGTQAQFYTADPLERDRTRIYRTELRYDGVAFYLPVGRLPGTMPIYRLSRAGDYVFAASAAERDRIEFVEGWHLDGVAFHAYPAGVAPPPTCAADQYWDLVRQQCTALCPLATDVYVPGAGCQKKRACTGGTLIAQTNSCQCDGGLIDNPTADRCEPPPCGGDEIFVVGRGCEVKRQCLGGTVNDRNECTCAPGEFLADFFGIPWCILDSGFLANTGDENSGPGGDGPGGSGGDGGAGMGAAKNALVEFWGVDSNRLVLLGQALSDPVYGLVRFSRGEYDGPAWVRFRGRAGATYFDEALGKDVPFPEGAELNALVGRLDRSVGVTPLTEAAFQYARMHFRSPGMVEPQKIELILANGYYNEANEFVRQAFNANMSSAAAVNTDITQFPYPITANTQPESLPNDKRGRYALQMASTTYGAQAFNEQLRRSNSLGGQLDAPALNFVMQFAADMSDGKLDTRVDGKALAESALRTYTTRSPDLQQLGMPTNFLLSNTLSVGLDVGATEYASPSLAASIREPDTPPPDGQSNVCLGPNPPTFYSNGYGPLCCPVGRLSPSTTWPSGCPLAKRPDYTRVYVHSTLVTSTGEGLVINRANLLWLVAAQAERGIVLANVGCSLTQNPGSEDYSFDLPTSQVSSIYLPSTTIRGFPLQLYTFLSDAGGRTFSPCP